VYIALAGSNDIWAYEHAKRTLVHVAGSGALGLADGDGRAAALAQPSGMALMHALLYVADSGASAVRSLQTYSGKTQTLIGQGLFEFGDAVGTRAEARLQYPMAVAKDPDTANLWVLDSYNNTIRKLKLGGGVVTQFDLAYKLNCPMAMTATSGALWIANTHAHEILRVDTTNGTARRLPVGE
jgi:DNA-binding beta-propeller fold protein YncE